MVDGAQIDLLLFADERDATRYALELEAKHLLGFDKIAVVSRRIIGKIIDRRSTKRS
jgi:hypothetical protein